MYGEVHLVTRRSDGKKFALNRINMHDFDKNKKDEIL